MSRFLDQSLRLVVNALALKSENPEVFTTSENTEVFTTSEKYEQ